MNKKDFLKKEVELFKDGYSAKEIAILMNRPLFKVKLDLFRLINSGYKLAIK